MDEKPPPQQGDKLDPALGIEGWWINYPRIFLFNPPPPTELHKIWLPSGEECFGFSAKFLAKEFTKTGPFGQTAQSIVTNNEILGLVVTEEQGALRPGATRVINFVFSLAYGTAIRVPVIATPLTGTA
jgi:hypothetical protein